jgi:excisionase family DNA binding protein
MKTSEATIRTIGESLGDSLVDLRQVAEVLGVSVRSVNRLIASHALPLPVKVGRSSRLYLSDVKAYFGRLRNEYRRGEQS